MTSSVDANYRFIAAYLEVNSRIAQRQQAMALYVTLTVSLLAALVALGTSAGAASAPVEWLVLGFPVASLTLALLTACGGGGSDSSGAPTLVGQFIDSPVANVAYMQANWMCR